MSDIEINGSICERCGQPLFLDVEECKSFIEKKMKEGYLVCGCCGSKAPSKKRENQ